MLETLKKWGTDLTLKVKDLFTSPESRVYVKDFRRVITYDERKCQYPKNYDQIVESGKIIEGKDDEGNSVYKLLYGKKDKDGRQSSFESTKITGIDDRSYFTIDFLVNPKKNKDVSRYSGYYKPFDFSKVDLEKHIPVFEAQETKDPRYPFKLTNSSILTKKEKNKEGKIQEVIDEEGRNGELLYTSNYKKLEISFSEIRDQNNKLELDKSLISVPIVFAANLAKFGAKLLTSLPIKLGEYLIGKQNPIAKSFGYLLFTPAAAIKNLVNMGATILKAPVLLFVADEKKYGNTYITRWKYQWRGYWEETKSDYSVIKDGNRSKSKQEDKPFHMVGTWKELDAMRPGVEKELEEEPSKSSESIDQSKKPGKNLEEKSQNASNERINKNQERDTSHAERIKEGRNSQPPGMNTPSRP